MEEIEIESELSERYEGEAERLAKVVLTIRDGAVKPPTANLCDAVLNMLQNGCFCPSCMLAAIDPLYVQLATDE